MANRRQRAAKLARRKANQSDHRGQTRIEKHGRTVIEVPKGPQRAHGFHATDLPKHGAELKRAEQIVSFCDSIGFDPTPEQLEIIKDLFNRDEDKLREEIRAMAQRMNDETLYGFSVVDSDGSRVDPVELMDQGSSWEERAFPHTFPHVDEIDGLDPAMRREAGSLVTFPTAAEWTELEATAKRRRRGAKGYIKVMEDAGFKLVGANHKARESWVRA